MSRIACALAMGASTPRQLHAQSVSFEVVSVKASNSTDRRSSSSILPGGHFTAANRSLWNLIVGAYLVPEYLISGAPDWIRSERFDIEARAPANVIPTGLTARARTDFTRRMIQSMLADRFKLAVHRETKEMPIYELTVSKDGPKLRKAQNNACSDGQACHAWGPGNPGMREGFPGTSVDMDDLVDMLMGYTDRPIVNKTNIQGLFDIRLQWNPLPLTQQAATPRDDVPRERVVNADVSSLPDLFTAVQEQLGLKLESRRGPIETIVIDHVERPGKN
jgi:uncharacterized protein (TIGR03435 family)